MWIFMKFHHFNGILWNLMIFHEITHNSVKIHKNGPSAPPAPEPIEFLMNSNDSGGIPHPEHAQKSQKHAEFHGFHVFSRKKRKWRKFTISCQLRVWEWRSPPETSPDVTIIKGFPPRGRGGTHFSKILRIPLNSYNCEGFHEMQLL